MCYHPDSINNSQVKVVLWWHSSEVTSDTDVTCAASHLHTICICELHRRFIPVIMDSSVNDSHHAHCMWSKSFLNNTTTFHVQRVWGHPDHMCRTEPSASASGSCVWQTGGRCMPKASHVVANRTRMSERAGVLWLLEPGFSSGVFRLMLAWIICGLLLLLLFFYLVIYSVFSLSLYTFHPGICLPSGI